MHLRQLLLLTFSQPRLLPSVAPTTHKATSGTPDYSEALCTTVLSHTPTATLVHFALHPALPTAAARFMPTSQLPD